MKRLIILILFALLLGVTAEAQKVNRSFTTDTVQGAETIYFSGSNSISQYDGIVGFQFTKTDVADSCSVLNIQGSYDGTNYVAITGTGEILYTSTDGNFLLYDTKPKYLKYRLAATCAATDTVIFTNVRLIYKEE